MNYSTAAFIINKDLRAILATYEVEDERHKNSVKRTMFKTLDKTIKVGSIINVPSKTRHGITTCRVVEVDVRVDFEDKTHVDWVIGKVDEEAYKEILAQEEVAINTIRSAEERALKKKLLENLEADKEAIASLKLASS